MKTLLFLLALPLCAQTIPAGQIYQSAAQNGIEYVIPSVGINILNEKAGTNWKTIVVQGISESSIGMVAGALAGVIHLSTPVLSGLAIGHGWWDQQGQALFGLAAPNPSPVVSAVIQMTGSLTASPTSCGEGTMFASAITAGTPGLKKLTAKSLRSPQQLPVGPITTIIDGATVTFTPQGAAVLKNAAGSTVNQFLIVDVLACSGLNPVNVPRGASFQVNPETPAFPVVLFSDTTASINTDRVNKIMAAHEAGYLAANGEALPADPCAWDSCMTWESAALK